MNKSKAGGRVADQIGISGATPEIVVAAVLNRIAETLSRGEDFLDRPLRSFGHQALPGLREKDTEIRGKHDDSAWNTRKFKPGEPLKDTVNNGHYSEAGSISDRRQSLAAVIPMLKPAS